MLLFRSSNFFFLFVFFQFFSTNSNFNLAQKIKQKSKTATLINAVIHLDIFIYVGRMNGIFPGRREIGEIPFFINLQNLVDAVPRLKEIGEGFLPFS